MDTVQQPHFWLLLLAGGAFLLTFAAVATGRKKPEERRLDEIADDVVQDPDGPADRAAARSEFRIPQVEKELRKQEKRARLIQAGLYGRNAAVAFVILRCVLFCALAGSVVALGLVGVVKIELALVMGSVFAIVSTVAPSLWLDRRKKQRQTLIRRALPDALDILGVCMAGGLSMTGALARVSRELAAAHPLLALELAIVDRETQLGRSTGEAMREFAYRFDLEELRNLATVILQAEKFGSSLTHTMEVYSETLREKRHRRAEELAQKATIKILFPTLLCIFPAMFIVIVGPAAIQIYNFIVVDGMGQGR